MPKLVVVNRGKPREIEMGQELTIGRGYSNLLRLEGEEISRVHAIIYRRNDEFMVRDLDSKNGVFLNGNKIAYAQLGAGDRLQVGKYKMIFDPPADFDMDGFVKSAGRNEQRLLEENKSSPTVTPVEAGFSSSKHFSVRATPQNPEGLSTPTPDPGGFREEVIIYTRQDLVEAARTGGSRLRDSIALKSELFFTELVSQTDTAKNLLEAAMASVVHAVSADRGVVILKDAESGTLAPGAMLAKDMDVAVNRVVLRSGFGEGKALMCPRTEDSGLFRENETVIRDKISTLISVPIGKAEPFGLLYVDRLGESDAFELADFLVVNRAARLLEWHLAEVKMRATAEDMS